MKIFSVKLFVTLMLLIGVPAQAQIYKCKDTAGRVTLQQTPCPGVGAMVATPAETAPRDRVTPPGSPGATPDARDLTSLIAAALAEQDYRRAESLAVTAEHHTMINEAKRFNPNTCKFQYYALGDELGKTLAAAAKEECLSTKGQLGPAYTRWKDHYQVTSARRSSAAARDQQQPTPVEAYNQALRTPMLTPPPQSLRCRKNYIGGMDCTPY